MTGDITREGRAHDEMRRRIQSRIFTSLATDAPIIWEHLDRHDREEVFKSKATAPSTEGSVEERAAKRRESYFADPGIAHLLAFVYVGLDERRRADGAADFESVLKSAMRMVAEEKGWTVEDFEFRVKFGKTPAFDEWAEALRTDEGEVDHEKVLTLYERDYISKEEYLEHFESR